MAIKVAGTIVIDDSRNLQNTVNVNATGNVYANTFFGDGSQLKGLVNPGQSSSFSANNVAYNTAGYITAATVGHIAYSNVQYQTIGFGTPGMFRRITSYRETISTESKDVTVSYSSDGAISEVSITPASNTSSSNTSSSNTSSNSVITFTVTNSGAGAYLINGNTNPTLNLTRGQQYQFNINASGHPFYINTANTTGTGSAYNNGVANNGIEVGVISFNVPNTAPATLHYNCEYHISMGGPIIIS